FHIEFDFLTAEEVFDFHVPDVIHRHFARQDVFNPRNRLSTGSSIDTDFCEICHLRFGHGWNSYDNVLDVVGLHEMWDVLRSAGNIHTVDVQVLLRLVVINEQDGHDAILRVLLHLADNHGAGLSGTDYECTAA